MTREEEIEKAAYHNDSGYEDSQAAGFMDGAEWADSHPINPWKSADIPPKADGEYFIRYNDLYSRPFTGCGRYSGKNGWEVSSHVQVITHFMPIPELPKEDTK